MSQFLKLLSISYIGLLITTRKYSTERGDRHVTDRLVGELA